MLPLAAFGSAQLPTGEVQVGQNILEPGYDEADGRLLCFFLITPIHVPLKLKLNTPLAPL